MRRHKLSWLAFPLLIAALILSACDSLDSGTLGGAANPNPTPQLSLEQADQVAQTFLKAWVEGDYQTMYGLISPNSREVFTEEAFSSDYQTAAVQFTQTELETAVTSSLRQGTTAVIQYDVRFHTELFGVIEDLGRTMRLIETPEGWRVAWSRMDIMDGLAEGARLERLQTLPGRGNIYDRNGKVLVDQNGRSIGIYLVQQDIVNVDECIALLSRIFRREVQSLERTFAQFLPETRFIVGEIDPETYQAEEANLRQYCDVGDDQYDTVIRSTRRYFGELAPHVVGYVGQIQPEQVAEYERKGYPANALIGQTGIEKAFERYLAGRPGGQLVIRSPEGVTLRAIAEAPAEPGQSVYLTLDRDLQTAVQNAFVEAYNFSTATWATTSPGGAAVVLDIKTGEVLAAVSYPWFDPNLFNPDSLLQDRVQRISDLGISWRTPLLDRVLLGKFPAGSVFKVVSAVAGLDSGVYTPQTAVNCTGTWYGGEYGDGLPFRSDWYAPGHGYMDFAAALTNSCNVYFWQLGVSLQSYDPESLTNYAYKMGLGVPTGQDVLPEEVGQIPNRELIFRLEARQWNISDMLNLVIGQGPIQITPMQMARATVAIANGGTLYKPLFVSKVQIVGEDPVYVAEPEATAQLDFAPEVFEMIRQAMCDVTLAPTGTARYIYEEWYRFQGSDVVVCGKTGTAQTGGAGTKPQAWFIAFAPQDDPQIAVVATVENSCEGSEVAAPLVRRIIEDYYGMPHSEWPPLWVSGCIPLGE